jgi:hypothetical protein
MTTSIALSGAVDQWLAIAREIYPDAATCPLCQGDGRRLPSHPDSGHCEDCLGHGFLPRGYLNLREP